MCQETTDPTSESNTSSGSVVENDCADGIIIRRYESSDEEQVKLLFRSGMKSLTPAAYTAAIKHPNVALPLTSLPAVVAAVTTINRSLTATGKRSPLWVAAAAAAVVLPATGLYFFLKNVFSEYIEASLEDDLNKIEEVYSGKSCFLVAVDTRSENGTCSIVGIVGGHARDDDGVIELRRMSVSSKKKGRGLGKRLVQRLEVECKPSKMFLTTTSIQYAAHRLYSGVGFTLKETSSWLFRNSLQFYYYEKEY